MISTSFRIALSALCFAGAVGLASTGLVRAESVMKECGDDWKVAKANGSANGMTWQEFLKQCRTQKESSAAPAATPAAAPAPAPTYQPKPVPAHTAARATGAGQFTTAAEAQGRCPADKVVWVNTKSHIYHYAGTHSYGTTKQGAYMCEADANAAGDRASKSRVDQPKQQP